jgi:flagellar motor protein MotB
MRLAPQSNARPPWLITLADLSLLLVGFFVFMQATSLKPRQQQAAIEAGIRNAFGGDGQVRIALEANAITGFAAGEAALPRDIRAVSGWAREALADRRTKLTVTGYSDGTAGDRLNGSALALAGLRADVAAAALASAVPGDRIRTSAAVAPGARRVTLAISYDP